MKEHDPIVFAGGISAKLASRSRHVCFFLGAGTSKSCGLPDLFELTNLVLDKLNVDNRALLETQLNGGNLESALSRIRRIASVLREGQELDGLSRQAAKALDQSICQEISNLLTHEAGNIDSAIHLAAWAQRCRYSKAIELFTVNYDTVIETALETQKVPYFDGFLGTLKGNFHIELVENDGEDKIPNFFVRLWKLHGSVNWKIQESKDGDTKNVVRSGIPGSMQGMVAIYPSDQKYEESRRVPFLVLQDRFRRALNEHETIVIISGYSFGDDHLNEIIFDAASRRERSEFNVFVYDTIPKDLADFAEHTPNLQVVSPTEAIIGGVRAKWKSPDSESGVWANGKFLLGDFGKLARYLSRISGDGVGNG